MTLQQLLIEGIDQLKQSGSPDAELDARQCLMAAFHLDVVHFLLNRMQELEDGAENQASLAEYRRMIARRSARTPLQQILGCQEFMGLEFYVNEHVLIPRQDTETLVELVLEEQCGRGCEGTAGETVGCTGKRLLDMCTGSGCIVISLAVKGSFQSVTAADLSEEALKVARRNAARLLGGEAHQIGEALQTDGEQPVGGAQDSSIRFCQGDLFDAIAEDQRFDVITSNPPYIPTAVVNTLEPEVRDHEPMMALDGMEDGLYFYRRIAAEAGKYLNPGGSIYLEIGYDQGEMVSELLRAAGFTDICVHKDLPGNDRVVRGTWNS